jgi:hypothetical protein
MSTFVRQPRTSAFDPAGAFSSLTVAATIVKDPVNAQLVTLELVFAGLVGGIVWNLPTWLFGIPSSSAHALIGGPGSRGNRPSAASGATRSAQRRWYRWRMAPMTVKDDRSRQDSHPAAAVGHRVLHGAAGGGCIGAVICRLVPLIGRYAGVVTGFGALLAVSEAIRLRSRTVPVDHTNVNQEGEGDLTCGLDSATESNLFATESGTLPSRTAP